MQTWCALMVNYLIKKTLSLGMWWWTPEMRRYIGFKGARWDFCFTIGKCNCKYSLVSTVIVQIRLLLFSDIIWLYAPTSCNYLASLRLIVTCLPDNFSQLTPPSMSRRQASILLVRVLEGKCGIVVQQSLHFALTLHAIKSDEALIRVFALITIKGMMNSPGSTTLVVPSLKKSSALEQLWVLNASAAVSVATCCAVLVHSVSQLQMCGSLIQTNHSMSYLSRTVNAAQQGLQLWKELMWL